MAYRRFRDLRKEGLVHNRQTLEGRIERGVFPPPVQLSENVVAWTDEDLNLFRERARRGDLTPHPEWLVRAATRRANMNPERTRRLQHNAAKARKGKACKHVAAPSTLLPA